MRIRVSKLLCIATLVFAVVSGPTPASAAPRHGDIPGGVVERIVRIFKNLTRFVTTNPLTEQISPPKP